jgi:AbrB family looped-hinge helix DNA binding protein
MTITLSSKYQVVIPKEVRERLHLKPGIKMQVVSYGTYVEFVPVGPMKKIRGSLKGMDTEIIREKDRF